MNLFKIKLYLFVALLSILVLKKNTIEKANKSNKNDKMKYIFLWYFKHYEFNYYYVNKGEGYGDNTHHDEYGTWGGNVAVMICWAPLQCIHLFNIHLICRCYTWHWKSDTTFLFLTLMLLQMDIHIFEAISGMRMVSTYMYF